MTDPVFLIHLADDHYPGRALCRDAPLSEVNPTSVELRSHGNIKSILCPLCNHYSREHYRGIPEPKPNPGSTTYGSL